MLMGFAISDPAPLTAYTFCGVCCPFADTFTATAAARPTLFRVNTAGATDATGTLAVDLVPSPAVTVTVAFPDANPAGASKLIWPGATYRSGAVKFFPVESAMVSDVPLRLIGSGGVTPAMDVARLTPFTVASDPGAMARAPGFADEVTVGVLTIAGVVALGVNDTPRKTSPAAAVLRVVNCAFAAAEAVVLARTSVMETSLLGSAPGSP